MTHSVENLYCSFCRKGQDKVAKLISSPADGPRSYICDECVAVCNSILGEGPGEHSDVQRRRSLRGLRIGLHRWIDRMFGAQRKSPPIGVMNVL
jgi:ATP-dependent protease Clp ATPase subunit